MDKTEMTNEAVYDASTLGTGKMLVLGLQHLFAMFGATVLVPAITGLNVSTTLFFAGLGTLIFHLITGRKVPAFLGSSFAFLGGYAAIAPTADAAGNALDNSALLPYACAGVAVAGLVYLVLAGLFKVFGCALEHDVCDSESKNLIGPVQHLAGYFVALIEFFSHTRELRSLTWEYIRFFHLHLSKVSVLSASISGMQN